MYSSSKNHRNTSRHGTSGAKCYVADFRPCSCSVVRTVTGVSVKIADFLFVLPCLLSVFRAGAFWGGTIFSRVTGTKVLRVLGPGVLGALSSSAQPDFLAYSSTTLCFPAAKEGNGLPVT